MLSSRIREFGPRRTFIHTLQILFTCSRSDFELHGGLSSLILARTHCLALIAGLLELFVLKRLRWKRGVVWGFVVQAGS